MAIDLKKMRAKLDAVRNKGGKIWKPKLDSNTKARVLPTPDGDPFKDKWFHYNLGKQSVLCPKRNFDEECPVCDFASELWKSGVDEDDEDKKSMAKGLFARQRFFSPIILREDKEPVIKVWGYSKTVYEKFLSKVINPQYGDITDPETGTDFEIQYFKKGDKSFPDTELEFDRQPSSLCGEIGEDKCTELLESIPDFDELYERKSPSEVQDILDEFMESGGESSDVEKFSGSASEQTSVDAALDDLKPSKKKAAKGK